MSENNNVNLKKITNWFDDIDKGELPRVDYRKGWAKIAFTYTFNFLKNAPDNRNNSKFFETAIS
jgi:hypothetical protein